jgi:uncharacterized membrane protein YfcA
MSEKPELLDDEPEESIEVGELSESRFPKNLKLYIWSAVFILSAIVLTFLWLYEPSFKSYVESLTHVFYYFLAAGFVFAMIDGAIGMSYGVTSTTFSLSMGIPPASASAAVHLSEILSNAIAGWMHFKMGNVNKRLFRLLVIAGSIGAILGAYLLSSLEHYSMYTKPVVSLYTLILGSVILTKALNLKKRKRENKRIRHIRALGFGGGFIDAVGGGGWGSIVLSSLIAGGRNPRTSLGSVKLSRFFIAILSSLTFVTMLNTVHWEAIGGLVIGSAMASPIAARISNKISVKSIMVAVGIIVILVSLRSIFMFLGRIL